ncbi:hypothetical protein RJ639_032412 [Escallonia herrerae]|uniref:HIG1 domain-containing protein n=1 Tax=Escallonia herrerae TaxID=1293975 RepID=A0AA88WUU3_9ASTE|nr:hypothetical protein RJ639_032412 [Escallonia herrerae]
MAVGHMAVRNVEVMAAAKLWLWCILAVEEIGSRLPSRERSWTARGTGVRHMMEGVDSNWRWQRALITAGVLTAGLISFRQGNAQLGQKLMRARVAVQGATVALMVGTAYHYGEKF